MAKQDIVVIRGSMGSNTALKQILGDLPADLPASVFVATHVSSTSEYARQTGRAAVAHLHEARAAEFERYTTVLRDAATAAMRAGRLARPEEA